MEFLNTVQKLLQEHMYTVGIGLVVLVAVAAVAWYYLGRQGSSSADRAPLENMARVNEATMGGMMPEQQEPQQEPVPQTDDEHAHVE